MKPPYKIYSGFKMDKKGVNLSLKPHRGLRHDRIRACPVKILDSLPETRDNTYSLSQIPPFIEKPAGVSLMFIKQPLSRRLWGLTTPWTVFWIILGRLFRRYLETARTRGSRSSQRRSGGLTWPLRRVSQPSSVAGPTLAGDTSTSWGKYELGDDII